MENIGLVSLFGQTNIVFNYVFLTLLSYLNFSLIIDFILTRLFFSVTIPHDNALSNTVEQYIHRYPGIVLYRKNARLEPTRYSKKVSEVEKILENKVTGDDYTLIRMGMFIYKISTEKVTYPNNTKNKTYIITTYWGGEKAVLDLLINIKKSSNVVMDIKKIEVASHNNNGWWYNTEFIDGGKKIENLILDKNIKDKTISDIEDFFESEEWYRLNSISHKRGYLLHGPPGCGKSSFIMAIAEKYRLTIRKIDIYDLVNRRALDTLFGYHSANSLYVIEDVDAIYTNRAEEDKKPTDNNEIPKTPEEKGKKLNISFSDFLNVLDGIGCAKNCIIIMTTNHPEKLDPALVRPGRIDVKVEFRKASAAQVAEYFTKIYPHIKYLPNFGKILGDKRFSMATIQGLAIKHKKDHNKFLDELRELVDNH